MPNDDTYDRLLLEANRNRLGDLWQRRDQPTALGAEERRLLKAMEAHQEFYPLWERLPHLTGSDLMVGAMNPLAHIALHATVEAQAELGSPPLVAPTLEALIKEGFTRHRAIHLLGQQLTMELSSAIRANTPDGDRYERRLRLIQRGLEESGGMRKLARRTGRNDPCPCGSGKKFKRCCIELISEIDVSPGHWHFLLPSDLTYLLSDYADHVADDDPVRLMHNLSAVALTLELAGDLDGVLATYEEIVAIAKTTERAGFLQDAMGDAVQFGLRHPTMAAYMLTYSESLIESDNIRQHHDPCVYATALLDHADLLTYVGRADEAATLYGTAKTIVEDFPEDDDLAAIVRTRTDTWQTEIKSGAWETESPEG